MEGTPLGIVQEIEVWPYKKMVYAQFRICPVNWDEQTLLGFWNTNGSLNLGQRTRPKNRQHQQKKKKKKKMKEKKWELAEL